MAKQIMNLSLQQRLTLAAMANSYETTGGPWVGPVTVAYLTMEAVRETAAHVRASKTYAKLTQSYKNDIDDMFNALNV